MVSSGSVRPDETDPVATAGLSLSVVIPCRDGAKLLPLQLAALHNQERTGWIETIVVDDGSTDGTSAIAESYGHDLPGFRVVRTPATNKSVACNVGLAVSTGTAVVFLDQDDEAAPGYLAALQRALVDHPFVAACVDHDALNPTWTPATRLAVQVTGLRHDPQQSFPVAMGASLAARREVLDAVGGFDESMAYAEDTDLCWRLALQGVPLTFVPDAVLRYRYRPTARQTYRQWRGYGRGTAALDRRYGHGPGRRAATRFGAQLLRLVAECRHLPRFGDPSVRQSTARQAGHQVGWLQGTVAARRYRLPPKTAKRER